MGKRQMSLITVVFLNGESHKVNINRQPDEEGRLTRYEVEVIGDGISTYETDAYGDNPTTAWTFPCNSTKEAADKFVELIEEKRKENK